jgi:hypothetical protein
MIKDASIVHAPSSIDFYVRRDLEATYYNPFEGKGPVEGSLDWNTWYIWTSQ